MEEKNINFSPPVGSDNIPEQQSLGNEVLFNTDDGSSTVKKNQGEN